MKALKVAHKEKALPEEKIKNLLHQYILKNFKVNIPRTKVCPNHDAPFDFVYAAFMAQYKRILAMANRSGGKCVASGTRVITAERGFIPVETFSDKQVFSYDLDNNAYIVKPTAGLQDNGVQDCIKVTTRTGREHIATFYHKLCTNEGWVESQHLEVGDYIAVAYNHGFGDQPIGEDIAEFLGYIIGNGGVTQDSVYFSTPDEELVKRIQIKDFKVGPKQSVCDYRLNNGGKHFESPTYITKKYGVHVTGLMRK